ncbi:MAG: V-type ATPase subunit [Candidatus Omnitrophota bacterium]
MTKHISELNYAFAVGKIRATERFLIKEEVFQEAISADLDSALRLFAESGRYSDELLRAQNSPQIEEALEKEATKLKKLASELILEDDLLQLLDLSSPQRLESAIAHCNHTFLKDYLMHLADMHNIKTFLRLRILEEPQDVLIKHLVFAGFIKRETFIEVYPLELGVFLHRLEYVYNGSRLVDYAYFLREAIEIAQQKRSFIMLEKSINDFLIQALRPAKYLSFGPGPVLAYYFAKSNEINLIRMIILAKLNNLPAELVQERLNNVYA